MKQALFLILFFVCSFSSKAQHQIIIHFNSNESSISEKDSKLLDSFAVFIKSNAVQQISVSGYTDNTGPEEKNKTLSQKRAASVTQYLIAKGIIPSVIQSEGLGVSSPIADNTTEQGKALNRRTSITAQMLPKKNANMPVAAPVAPPTPEPVDKQPETFGNAALEVGATLILKNINFVGGTADLLPESKPALESLLKTMKDNPTLEIEIGGHVCCANDMPLSIERAKAVFEYLAYKGISEKRMTYKGYSRNKPIGDDATEEGRKQNRRVDITIIKK
ncbi:MAG: OmpA family protein [Bacteroidia bacterium]|nr:OmpA family protein [Bacteroidia bacterium]